MEIKGKMERMVIRKKKEIIKREPQEQGKTYMEEG